MHSNSCSETKLYHLAVLSVFRGGRVVHETDSMVRGNSKIFSTNVDFPDPEGPETIITKGSNWLACVISYGCAASLDVLHLLAQFLDFRLNFQSNPRDFQPFFLRSRRLGKQGIRFALHFLQQKIALL